MRPRAIAAVVVLALALAPALALGQENSPVLLERVDTGELAADVGHPATATFRLFNLNPSEDFYVTATITGTDGWSTNASRVPFFLTPRNETFVDVRFEPRELPRGTGSFTVTFSFVHSASGEVTRVEEEVEVRSAAPPRILGNFPNPLPAPFDNEYGSFLLDLAGWLAIAFGAALLLDLVVRLLTARAQNATTSGIARKLRRPVFFLVFFLGFASSFEKLPRNAFTAFASRFLIAVAVTVFGLYVLYRGLEAALLYYQREIAPKTATKVDDVLVPAFRKVGLIIIYVAGIILTLRNLGWDPTLIFAGAGIAGLVIAFAAQDTFSNLFSGIFLMLDRPFLEGDVILLETGEVARVESIGLRTTDLYEYDHHHVITVPNNQLATKRIVNYSAPDSNFRVDIFVDVAYGTDLPKAEAILREIALAEPEIVNSPDPWGPAIQVREFRDSGIQMMLRVTLKDPRDRNRVPSKVRFEIRRRFDEAGIEIPFPQRVVHVKNER